MHNLGFYFIEQLPNQLANPVAILKSKNQKNSLIVVSEMIDTNNNTVLIVVHLDKNGRININNEVTSVYGKSGYKSFIEQNRKSGNVLYENKNIGLASLPADGLQLSAVEATTDLIFNIYDFNRNYNTNSENSENVLPTATDSIKQTVENNVLPKAWVDMTEAWLYDKDAVKNKT